MKLSRSDVTRLQTILQTASLAKIEAICFKEEDLFKFASGLNKASTCAMITTNLPTLPQKLGLNRVNILKSRLDLLINHPDLCIDAKEHERGEISQLEIVAGKAKMTYRASATSMIKAPREIEDPLVGLCTIKKDQWDLIAGAISSMKAENVCMILKQDGQVIFEAADESTTDRFSVVLDDLLEAPDGIEESMVHYLPSDIFTTIARHAMIDDVLAFSVGIGGTVKMIVNDCEMSIFAQVNTED